MLKITPEGKQREVLALPAEGHTVVLGTAGSGKTTIALLRAYHLSLIPGSGKVLLVTFNGALVEYMRSACQPTSKLIVENYHKFARGYLNSRDKMPRWNGILNSDEKEHFIVKALEILRKYNPNESTLKRSKEFFIDEINFIEKFGFTDLSTYYDAERIGRSAAYIRRDNRKWIFDVYSKYIELREEAGKKYDWDDLALYAYKEFQNDDSARKYSHIIVDEGQDFSPMMIKSLVAAVADGGSFTFFGDVAQQIYGSRLSWRDSGINTEKVWRFNMNYRNPAAISNFARDITKSRYWRQDDDMIDATAMIAEGPKPILVKFSDVEKEASWVVERAISTSRTSSSVIICRKRTDIDSFMSMLKDKGFDATEIDKNTPGFAHIKTVYLTTFHAAKGLEFENVFVPLLNTDKLPDPDLLANNVSSEETYADEAKLLYVAVTRSKFGLYMSYSKTLTPLFPEESDNCIFYDEETIK